MKIKNGMNGTWNENELRDILEGSIGRGWHPIVIKLCDQLVEAGWDRQLHQVKEKFGGLRFYIGKSNEKIQALIEEAENKCDKTCEECGAEGKLMNTGGWDKTLCSLCAKPSAKYV